VRVFVFGGGDRYTTMTTDWARDKLFTIVGYALLILTPFIVGFFVAAGAEHHLGAGFPFNVIIAVVMELAGILSMHLVSRIMAWNETHEKQAPTGWAIAGTASYSIIALSIIVLLDWPASRVTAVKGSFVLLGVVVYMLFALYHQQVRRERDERSGHDREREDERWKYTAEREYRLERLRIKEDAPRRTAVETKPVRPHADIGSEILAYYVTNGGASMRQVATDVGCSTSTVNKHVKRLEASGKLKRNGSGRGTEATHEEL